MKNQYTLWQILGIWFAAGAPMWILGWVTYPALSEVSLHWMQVCCG